MTAAFSVRPTHTLALAILTAASPATARAQQTDTARLAPVTVTVTRETARSSLDLPYAISVVAPDSARPGQRKLSIEELLLLLPGVSVVNRHNPAQDPRIAIRGFGSRSAFGVRGVRVMRDGMPMTLPDGQTPLDYLDLEAVGSIQAIRGSASALYGNAAGGVIDVRTVDPPRDPFVLQARASAGSFNTHRWTGSAGGGLGAFRYQGNVTRTETDGFRDYSRLRSTHGFARLLANSGGNELALQALLYDQPLAENPGALTAAQMAQDPEQADVPSVTKRARKTVRQGQIGLTGTRALAGAGELSAALYGGWRDLENPLTFAVVGVDRTSYGASLRGTVPVTLLSRRTRISAGVDLQRQEDDRGEWENCNAVVVSPRCPVLGVERGAVRKDQTETVSSAGPFVRAEMALPARTWLSGGLRADYVRFEVDDRLVTATDSNDSGERTLDALSYMLGLTWRARPLVALYANVSSSFETPTATELGNKPDGSAGINPNLDPQYATTYEAGVKGMLLHVLRYDLAGFHTDVRDELVPFEIVNGGGRRYFLNAGRTTRRGAEVGLGASLGTLDLAAAYSRSHFRFTDFTLGTTSYAGRTIPGVPEQQGQASLTMRGVGMYATLEGIAASRAFVDNDNSARAAGYAIANVRLGGTAAFGRPWLSPVIGVQNVFDRRYVSSIAVNAAGGKYFEPAPGRIVYVGLTAASGR